MIEFMYKHFKRAILRGKFPTYMFQVVLFFLSVLLPRGSVIKLLSDFANIGAVMFTVLNIWMNAKYAGRKIFDTVWVYYDLLYIFGDIFIAISNIVDFYTWTQEQEGVTGDFHQVDVRSVRIVQSILSITIFGKMMYYLQLVDQIAPLVTIIFKVFGDIYWFMVIFILNIFMFATSFFIIARN